MIDLAAVSVCVLILDQTLKLLVLHRLGADGVSLGPLGKLQPVKTRIWWARWDFLPHLTALWSLWLLAAAMLVVLCVLFPACRWFSGVLLGASFSHVLETSLRGSIRDYVCLRFWPAFNFADVAISIGAVGVVVQMLIALTEMWP